MWYEWECLDKKGEIVGYCIVEYDHEITTDTLQADAETALHKMQADQWLQSAAGLGKVHKV